MGHFARIRNVIRRNKTAIQFSLNKRVVFLFPSMDLENVISCWFKLWPVRHEKVKLKDKTDRQA
jgi:hypothetical protein